MPTAFSEYEKMTYPRWRKFSLQTTMAMPASSPMATRPAGPIQLLSKANFRKYETPINTAVIPIRFSQWEPMRDSKSVLAGLAGGITVGLGGMTGTAGFSSADGGGGGTISGRSGASAA